MSSTRYPFLSTKKEGRKRGTEMKKKTLALLLAVTMTVSALAACGSEKKTSGEASVKEEVKESSADSAAGDASEAEEIAYPEEITIFANMGLKAQAQGFTSNNDAYWAQALEEITGTHVEWTQPIEAMAEKFNLMIASEEYTDAIVYDWPNVEGGPEMYVEDEVILDLTDLIPECMPNFNAYLEEHPNVKKIMQNEEGRILYIPFIRDDAQLNIYVGPLIRTDWLEKLGLEVPTTTDELYTVLKAFKEQDPNGNGEADEIPMSGVSFDENINHNIGNLLWAFDTTYTFYVEDGKVVWGPMEDKFVEGLEYIAMLFDEGLIDVDYLLNDRTAMDSKAIADRVGFEFSFQPTKYYNDATFNDGTRRMAGIPYLTTPDNDSQMCFNSDYINGVVTSVSFAVTTACEDPKGLLKWLDTIYSEEGIILMNWGEEGTHFEYVDGEPQYIGWDTMTADEKNKVQAETMVIDTTFPTLQQWDALSVTYCDWGAEAVDTWANSADTSGILPQISFTAEEKEQIADALTQIETYASTQMNNVVIGEMSIDEWPKVVEKFHDMGIDEILEVYNAAYQRYMSK